MSLEEIDLDESDYPALIKIFSVLRWVLVVCAVVALIVSVFLLFKGYLWYFVVPAYLVVNVIFSLLKNYVIGIVDNLNKQYYSLSNQTF